AELLGDRLLSTLRQSDDQLVARVVVDLAITEALPDLVHLLLRLVDDHCLIRGDEQILDDETQAAARRGCKAQFLHPIEQTCRLDTPQQAEALADDPRQQLARGRQVIKGHY